jgi:hypothetical protein
MEQGYYAFNYQGMTGFGFGCLRLENGRIAGFDFLRGRYDGTYQRAANGSFQTTLSMIFPPGVLLVTGAPAPTSPVQMTGTLPANFGAGAPFLFNTVGGTVQVSMIKMRDL